MSIPTTSTTVDWLMLSFPISVVYSLNFSQHLGKIKIDLSKIRGLLCRVCIKTKTSGCFPNLENGLNHQALEF